MQKMHVNRNLLEHLAGFARQAKSFACSRGGSGWKLQAQSALVAMDAIRTALETQHTNTMNLKICKMHPNATVPTYAHGTDACFDLYAATVDGKTTLGAVLSHGSPVVCGTGLAFEVPEGWALMVYSRSGHGFKLNTRLANCVGVVDCGYTGEVMVKLTMDDQFLENELDLYIKPGDRIAQAMLVQVPRVVFEVVEQLSLTERGAGGFGSSGVAG